MSIFRKMPINPGDLVIGVKKYGWDGKGAAMLQRYFESPAIVLEVNESQALIFFEQTGPKWYDITKLERCYVTDEYETTDKADRGGIVAQSGIDGDHSPGNKDNT